MESIIKDGVTYYILKKYQKAINQGYGLSALKIFLSGERVAKAITLILSERDSLAKQVKFGFVNAGLESPRFYPIGFDNKPSYMTLDNWDSNLPHNRAMIAELKEHLFSVHFNSSFSDLIDGFVDLLLLQFAMNSVEFKAFCVGCNDKLVQYLVVIPRDIDTMFNVWLLAKFLNRMDSESFTGLSTTIQSLIIPSDSSISLQTITYSIRSVISFLNYGCSVVDSNNLQTVLLRDYRELLEYLGGDKQKLLEEFHQGLV